MALRPYLQIDQDQNAKSIRQAHNVLSSEQDLSGQIRFKDFQHSTHPSRSSTRIKDQPILIELFINDIPRHPKTSLALFADDTAILGTSKNFDLLHQQLQELLCILADYFLKWRIKINLSKTTALYFTKFALIPPSLLLYGEWITFSREAKYFGVHLDWRFTWRPHFSHTIQKLNFASNALQSPDGYQ